MPSKAGSVGAHPMPEPALTLLALPARPSPSPFLSPEGLAPDPVSAT